jgi:excisionase family DNA binding protein
MSSNTKQPVWRRPKAAAQITGVSTSTLYRWLADGTIKTMKVGKDVRYVDVSQWVNPEPGHGV